MGVVEFFPSDHHVREHVSYTRDLLKSIAFVRLQWLHISNEPRT